MTLTYNEESCPETLVVKDYQNWLKRLRKVLSPEKIRFFLAGEYGEKTGRPHFHAAIFGLSPSVAGGVDGRAGVVADTWDLGYTFVGELNVESASYIAGYVTKKVNPKGVNEYAGRIPEFSRMSLRPGIGHGAMGDVARALSCDAGLDDVVRNGDVPHSLMHGMRKLPLGRYLRRTLRGEMGFASKDTPAEAQRLYGLQMRVLLEEALSVKENASKAMGKIVLDLNAQKRRNVLSRFKVRDARRVL